MHSFSKMNIKQESIKPRNMSNYNYTLLPHELIKALGGNGSIQNLERENKMKMDRTDNH